MAAAGHFDRVAPRYDVLRPVDADWWEVFDALVAAGDLRGRRVLELGCATGRLADALTTQALGKVWAVDASAEMVAEARANGVTARRATAEQLPFKDRWFERAVARMAVHLFDRRLAFAEIRRVLAADGRLVVATMDPAWFPEHWLMPWFPSVLEIDAARFPRLEQLEHELAAAGFEPRVERLVQHVSMTRDEALAKMGGRAFSTFDLIPQDEYRDGLERASAEFPERLDYDRIWLIATGVVSADTSPA